MKITEALFKSYLKCKYKAYLKISGQTGIKSDYENMILERELEFKTEAISKYFCIAGTRPTTPLHLNDNIATPLKMHKIFIDVKIEGSDIISPCC